MTGEIESIVFSAKKGIRWVWPPLRIPVANEGFWKSPTKDVMILVITVTGRPHPMDADTIGQVFFRFYKSRNFVKMWDFVQR